MRWGATWVFKKGQVNDKFAQNVAIPLRTIPLSTISEIVQFCEIGLFVDQPTAKSELKLYNVTHIRSTNSNCKNWKQIAFIHLVSAAVRRKRQIANSISLASANARLPVFITHSRRTDTRRYYYMIYLLFCFIFIWLCFGECAPHLTNKRNEAVICSRVRTYSPKLQGSRVHSGNGSHDT